MSVTTNKGFIAGLIMTIILFALTAIGVSGGSGASYIKYIPLAIILGIYLDTLSSERTDFYKHALKNGVKISAVSGAVLAVANIISFLIAPAYSFSKYNLSPTKFTGAMAVSGTLLLEVTVLGMILTFIFFQMFKNRKVESV